MEHLVPNTVDSYPTVLEDVLMHGDKVTTRDYTTREIRDYTIVSDDPRTYMIDTMDEDFFRAEAETVRYGEKPTQYAPDEQDELLDLEDNVFYEDIVRERFSTLWSQWLDKFKEDRYTRRAVAGFTDGVESPCTTRFQLMVRNGELHCHTFNRSQDMLFAYPMDTALFQRYQCEFLNDLKGHVDEDIELGEYRHTMTSAHIYEDQIDEVKETIQNY